MVALLLCVSMPNQFAKTNWFGGGQGARPACDALPSCDARVEALGKKAKRIFIISAQKIKMPGKCPKIQYE